MSSSGISDLLAGNFPEYSRLYPDEVEKIYDDVQVLHPEWIRSMRHADRHSNEIEQMLGLIMANGFSRWDRFGRDTNCTEAMLGYLEELLNTPEVEEVGRGSRTDRGNRTESSSRTERAQRMDVDQDYLDALPAELREEVLMQHGGTSRSQPTISAAAQGSSPDISSDFLDALPQDLRDQILWERAQQSYSW